MRPSELLDRLNLVQKSALLLAMAASGDPIRGKLWFQKEMFLLAKGLPDLSEELAYEPSLMGPLSDALDWNLDQLEAVGLIERSDSTFRLTDEGEEHARLASRKLDSSKVRIIEETKQLLNDLPKDELLAFIYFLYPEMTVESEELQGLLPRRRDLAAKLYARGKVGLERGATIADLGVQEFAALLRRKGIPRYSE